MGPRRNPVRGQVAAAVIFQAQDECSGIRNKCTCPACVSAICNMKDHFLVMKGCQSQVAEEPEDFTARGLLLDWIFSKGSINNSSFNKACELDPFSMYEFFNRLVLLHFKIIVILIWFH